jgi:ubiquinone/menaquinone biosynthesis C-methylase UbiE
LVGADPLAEDYRGFLERINVSPNCELVSCAGQQLVAAFGPAKFDVVTSINALDHSESPKEVFDQMVAVCKPGGFVYLFHAENEGLHERYYGMHQWNFRKENGNLVANDGRKSVDFLYNLPNVTIHSEKTIPAAPRPLLEWIFHVQ